PSRQKSPGPSSTTIVRRLSQKSSLPSPRQGGEALINPLQRDARQSFEFSARFCFCLGDAGNYAGHLVVFGLASKLETVDVRVINVDREQPRELRDRSSVFDAVRSRPLFNLAEALGRNDEGAMLHTTYGVAVAGRLLALRYLYPRRRFSRLDVMTGIA